MSYDFSVLFGSLFVFFHWLTFVWLYMVSYIVSSEALSTALVGTQKKFNKGGGLGVIVSVCVCVSLMCVREKGVWFRVWFWGAERRRNMKCVSLG